LVVQTIKEEHALVKKEHYAAKKCQNEMPVRGCGEITQVATADSDRASKKRGKKKLLKHNLSTTSQGRTPDP